MSNFKINDKLQLFSVWLIFVMVLTFRASAYASTTKKVLYINSYHQGYSWSDDIEAGFIEALNQSGLDIELSREYLDSQRFPSNDGFTHIVELFGRKYIDYHPELIFVSDNNAFHFAVDNRQELFPDASIVFVGYNNFNPSLIEGIDNITGLNEKINPSSSINLGLSLFPETTDIAILVSSQNKSDTASRKLVVQDLIPFLSTRDLYRTHLLDNVSVAEAKERMGNLPSDTLLFVFGRTTDKRADRNMSPGEGLALIAGEIEQPIFGTWSFQIGKGILGGNLLTGTTQGKIGGQMAVDILKGKPASSIPIRMVTPLQPTFDAGEMRKFGITEQALPIGSIVVNDSVPFWREHLGVLVAVVVVVVVVAQSLLLFYLWVNYRQKRLAIQGLKESKNTLEDKVRERTLSLEKAKSELEILSETDELTQIRNRRYLEKRTNIELNRAFRQNTPLSLLMIDIDYFKEYNDTYGHVEGDECLKKVAEVIQKQCKRDTDLAARYGGEEFAILLPDTPLEGAESVANRLMHDIELIGIMHERSDISAFVTMSIGVITYFNTRKLISREMLFRLADDRLYQAKKQGRNQCVCGMHPSIIDDPKVHSKLH